MTITEIKTICADAVMQNGWQQQAVVALEELSEAQKEICKYMRGKGDAEHLAEELADAIIMIEQMEIAFDVKNSVRSWLDKKAQRLADRMKGGEL